MSVRPVILYVIASADSVPAIFGAEKESVDSVMRLSEVVVTGTNGEVAKNLLPYSVSVVGRERLESTGETQVLSAISDMVPSLFTDFVTRIRVTKSRDTTFI